MSHLTLETFVDKQIPDAMLAFRYISRCTLPIQVKGGQMLDLVLHTEHSY